MPSATLAESRLSTPPSSVKDKAAGRTSSSRDNVTSGNFGASRPCGTSPKWLPMVSIGKCSSTAATDDNITAINIPGKPGHQRQTAKILQLACDDSDSDTAGEAHRHRVRNVANERAQSRQADQRQKQSREQNREQQAVNAEFCNGRRDQNDKSACGSPDLKPAASQRGHQKSADDGGIQPPFRRNTGSHRDSIESGSATTATVSAAITSLRKEAKL